VQKNQSEMGDKLNKILDRVELDRPLLFKEKLETLLEDRTSPQDISIFEKD